MDPKARVMSPVFKLNELPAAVPPSKMMCEEVFTVSAVEAKVCEETFASVRARESVPPPSVNAPIEKARFVAPA